jgi:oligopeptide/dipeptide ABC transporter ATP-binding protein
MSHTAILACRNISKYYPVGKKGLLSSTKKSVKAVNGVTLEIHEGENTAIVGESGCGKTTLGRILCGLLEPTGGFVEYLGLHMDYLNRDFARAVQPIFQDPYSALNPRKTVMKILAKPFKIHGIHYDETNICDLLENVRLSPGKSFLDRYPHELSGGQRQRVVIARALALKPKLIVADEPVSGLDATVQEQILKLMEMLQETYETTYLVISHDISLVESMCTRIAVMYLGKIVEIGPTKSILHHSLHPYTLALLRSFPSGDPKKRDWIDSPPILGEVPSPVDVPSGCAFRTRCPLAVDECAIKEPIMELSGTDHYISCPVVLRAQTSLHMEK